MARPATQALMLINGQADVQVDMKPAHFLTQHAHFYNS
jgi:hypothetical protein